MARHGIWSRLVVCTALAGLALAPAYATEETAKEQPAEKKAAADEKDVKAESAKPAPGAKVAATGETEECKPTATRVNTLEDVFGIANWLKVQSRAAKPTAHVAQVAWRDATADTPVAPAKPAPQKTAD